MPESKGRIERFLEKTHPAIFSLYAVIAAFTTYFCMYSFRKPFSVGKFAGTVDLGILPIIDYKILLIISQVMGYTFSKFLGVKIVSEMSGRNRGKSIVILIAMAWGSLLVFGFVPKPWGWVCLFINGIPLGMIWGLVFGFLEGRKNSELLGAGLSASYIIASGVVKSIGQWIMNQGVSENWMPFLTGALFFPLLLLSVYALSKLPRPTAEDEKLRTKRLPMKSAERWLFFKSFAPGLVPLIFLYMLLTGYRDFRDNFAKEIWSALGYGTKASIYSQTEIPIIIIVLLSLAMIMLIKDNIKAMKVIHWIMLLGAIVIGLSTWAFQLNIIGPVPWMIFVGMGLYLGYVPFGCVLFDRLIAAVGFVGTAGFMIYLTDAFGYIGSVGLMLLKNFGNAQLSWLKFFINLSYVTSVVCTICFLLSLFYFSKIAKKTDTI